jgi:hypothetical protein
MTHPSIQPNVLSDLLHQFSIQISNSFLLLPASLSDPESSLLFPVFLVILHPDYLVPGTEDAIEQILQLLSEIAGIYSIARGSMIEAVYSAVSLSLLVGSWVLRTSFFLHLWRLFFFSIYDLAFAVVCSTSRSPGGKNL